MKKFGLILVLVCAFASTPALAQTTVTTDFESFATGTVDGQGGWSSTGATGNGCAVYDHAVVSNLPGTVPAPFGTQSLRISNATTSGCFGDQTFSTPLPVAAGETDAYESGGVVPAIAAFSSASVGTRQSHVVGVWDFIPAVPGFQPGLSVVVSPDNGEGGRMSWVQMTDVDPAGLDVNFYDYRDLPPYGSLESPGDGVGPEDGFFFTPLVTGLDRLVPHRIRIEMDLIDGPHNDVVRVYVDGILKVTGTSWEDYFRWFQGPGDPEETAPVRESRVVKTLLFRTGGEPVPSTYGNGFLIDNVSLSSGSPLVGPPTNERQCKSGGWKIFNNPSFRNKDACEHYVDKHKPRHDRDEDDHDHDRGEHHEREHERGGRD